ncbi:hypothetical protein LTR51_004131 [Lithohypha guttulata]|nr:hypothetical protein LTR51_004131 [Lithohypha guttulata]
MSYARPGFLASIVASVDKEPDSREVAAPRGNLNARRTEIWSMSPKKRTTFALETKTLKSLNRQTTPTI